MDEATLIQQIQQLTREQALEAAGFLADAIPEEGRPDVAAQPEFQQIADQPYQHLEEVEQVARLLLLAAATTEEYRDDVQAAIAGTGQKQVILGGMEIVALATIALGALHVLITKGKTSEEETTTFREENGQTVVEIKKKVEYGISGTLASMLKNLGGIAQ
ncbi:MAG TPA: hypothetical protein VLA19_02065 [Herpetosiphonaceae bacterium]|nr:hypothetical protein [Herpetosiphonaceae bacterium]